jgi:hypothetical protein
MMQAGDVRDRLMRMGQQERAERERAQSGGGGFNYMIGGAPIDPSTGTSPLGLDAVLEGMYQRRISDLRMQERQAQAAERAQRNQAMMQAAEMRREAMRRAAGGAMDMGGALAESGIYSPALVGIGQQIGSGGGVQGAAQARAARTAALETYLRNIAAIVQSARSQRSELDEWRQRQIYELERNQAMGLAAGSPIMGGL